MFKQLFLQLGTCQSYGVTKDTWYNLAACDMVIQHPQDSNMSFPGLLKTKSCFQCFGKCPPLDHRMGHVLCFAVSFTSQQKEIMCKQLIKIPHTLKSFHPEKGRTQNKQMCWNMLEPIFFQSTANDPRS